MKNIDKTLLGERLLCVCDYVRAGAVLCDVGTDHAKLPIYLAQNKKIQQAYATDINIGPIACAERNVCDFGLSGVIECVKCDGLRGTEAFGITDISICGMGGELIARILSECEYIKDDAVNLILQPMTHIEDVRRYLYDFGFEILDECLVSETGKLYTVINAVYSGCVTQYSDVDLILGKILVNKDRNELFFKMIDRVLYHLENRMKSNDEDAAESARVLWRKVNEYKGT